MWTRLKNGNAEINQVHGFCFLNTTDDSCVCQMTVTWNCEKLVFEVQYSTLASSEVAEKIHRVYLDQSWYSNLRIPDQPTGIPLCKQSIENVKRELGIKESLFQIYSKSSIILCDTEYVYKHIIDTKEAYAMEKLLRKQAVCERCVLPLEAMNFSDEVSFFKYRFILQHPLSRKEARACLPTFVQSIVQAIQEMHTVLRKAHLDIRLENICFSNKFEG